MLTGGPLPRYRVRALDRFDILGDLPVIELDAVENERAAGAWTATAPIPGPQSVAARMRDAAFPCIEIWDPDTDWRYWGIIDEPEEVLTSTGGDFITFRGIDATALLADRLIWPDTNVVTDWHEIRRYTGPASTLALQEVQANAAAGARAITGIQLAADPALGPTVDFQATGQNLLETIGAWFEGSANTWTFRLARAGQTAALEFRVFARPSSQVVVSPNSGTFKQLRVGETASTGSHVVGVGQVIDENAPEPQPRHVVEAGTPETDWRTRRVEVLMSRPSLGPVDLFSEAALLRNRNAGQRTVQVTGLEVNGYGRDLDLGWLVPVTVGQGLAAERVDLPVTSTRLTMRLNEETGQMQEMRTIDLGRRVPEGPGQVFDAIGRVRSEVAAVAREIAR